ncbi:MAG: tRNA lysidine(34) synthetase TilS [Candidatus Omnitrophota bacterium]|nr:MAG: tRNA lysidine(34) synthetase TilS [Candidatus Omnitrophota bacterium]
MDLTHKILNTINYYEMFKRGDKILVAVSGGPDSVYLLHTLQALKDKLGITLFVAHLNHGLRGEESERDARFVKCLAGKMGIKSVSKKLTPKKAKSKLSPEERLREKRYAFFKESCARVGADIVATAHTLDDQAETVMMRIIKGASLKGIVGIHPVRLDGNIKFIRPLIEIEKKDIIKYLKKNRVPFRIDRTNLENRFLRNRIRQRILPYLGKLNPCIKRSLFNLAENLREDYEFIEEEKKKRKSLIKSKKPLHYIVLSDILLQPGALRKEIVREALKSTGGNIKKLTFRHWRDVNNFIRTKKSGKFIDLPGGVKIKKTRDRLIFSK